ncbi:MAG: AbrB family transcriptional regulator [Paracoccaceae bacterium]|nr:AbrB family transcriptional regulator [Paracoccaceae bacterium]MDE2673697.1 AbrB family transcriptional regulator [Paracoccaceae bacterium]
MNKMLNPKIISFLQIKTLAYASLGGVVFLFLGLPIPLLIGPMLGCLVAALIGLRLKGFDKISIFMRTVLGVAIGSTFTPEILSEIGQLGASLIIIPLFLLVICAVGYFYFKFLRFDTGTSYYGSIPGGLVEMLVFGDKAGANVRALSLIHATRVLVIMLVVPFVITTIWDIDLTHLPGVHINQVPILEIGLMIFAAITGWRLAVVLKVPGATILGPMVLTSILTLTDLIHFRPPVEFIWGAQFFIGLGVGIRYNGVTGVEVRQYILSALGYCLLLGLVSLLFVFVVVGLLDTSPMDTLLAYLPGGQAEMGIIAIVSNADMAYVISHHALRLILVLLLVQVFARWILK